MTTSARSPSTAVDPIRLEILWNRVISAVNEQAMTLVRTSFSPITRDAGDYGAAVFDRHGRMVAQAVTGTPGHINPMSLAAKTMLGRYPPSTLVPGDALITNDPWLASGHLHDVMILSPIFRGAELVAFFSSLCHVVDVGGRGVGTEARDVYEEGLRITPMKFAEAGEPNETLYQILRENVRFASTVLADLEAQVSANLVGGRRLLEVIDEYGIDFDELSQSILDASRTATEAAIRRIPEGVYEATTLLDPLEETDTGRTSPLEIHAKLAVSDGTITVDYAGTTPQVEPAINVPLNYTHAYTTYALRTLIAPEIPNNDGSLEPIRVTAPEGTIVSARFPAPVSARHIVGMFVPFVVMRALSEVLPDRVMADGSGPNFGAFLTSVGAGASHKFSAVYLGCGGMGARAAKDGPSTTGYPTGITAIPVEVIEKQAPIVIWSKELVPDSGGVGRQRGGLGQRIVIGVLSGEPWLVNPMLDRRFQAAEGMFGGGPGGTAGVETSSGRAVNPRKRLLLGPDERLIVTLPGGGGYGSPDQRPPQLIERDLQEGLTTSFSRGRGPA